MILTRRDVLVAGPIGGVALASALLTSGHAEPQQEDDMAVVARLIGRTPTHSDRVHLVMPAKFPTGYTVPMDLDVDSPMTEDDHVKCIRVCQGEEGSRR